MHGSSVIRSFERQGCTQDRDCLGGKWQFHVLSSSCHLGMWPMRREEHEHMPRSRASSPRVVDNACAAPCVRLSLSRTAFVSIERENRRRNLLGSRTTSGLEMDDTHSRFFNDKKREGRAQQKPCPCTTKVKGAKARQE